MDKIDKNDQEALELGKKLLSFYESGYINRKQVLWFAFVKGVASGLGAFIGGTIVIAFLLVILSQFNDLPLVGHIAETVERTLHK